MKKLREQEVSDTKYKDLYVRERALLPVVNTSLNNLFADIELLKQKKQRLIVEKEGLHEEIVMSMKQFNVLQKQWPITRKSLDQKHAGDLISGNARIAKLRSELLQESRKDANAEQQLLPLSEAMKDINIKFGDLQKKVNRDKAAVKDTNTRLVKLTKDMDDQLALYIQQLRQKTDALNLRKTQNWEQRKKLEKWKMKLT